MKKFTTLLLMSLISSVAFADDVTISCGTQASSSSKAELVQLKKDAKKNGVNSSRIFKEENKFYVDIFEDSHVVRQTNENNQSYWSRQEQITKDLTLKIESIVNDKHSDVRVECGISG